jgi:hypothetical protein
MATVTTITYASPVTITIDLSSLVASSTWLGGRESTEIDNTTTKYMDVTVDNPLGIVATPTVIGQELRVYVWGQATAASASAIGTLVGADAARTVTNDTQVSLRLGAAIAAQNASGGNTHYFMPFSVAALFGGNMPKFWGIFVTHNIGTVNLGASQASKIRMMGITYTST